MARPLVSFMFQIACAAAGGGGGGGVLGGGPRRRPPRVPLRPRDCPVHVPVHPLLRSLGRLHSGRPATVASATSMARTGPSSSRVHPPGASDAHSPPPAVVSPRRVDLDDSDRPAPRTRRSSAGTISSGLRPVPPSGRGRRSCSPAVGSRSPCGRLRRPPDPDDDRTASGRDGEQRLGRRASAADHAADGAEPEQRSASGGPSSSHSTAGRAPCQRSATLSTPRRRGRGMPRSTGRATRAGTVPGTGRRRRPLDGDPPERPGQVVRSFSGTAAWGRHRTAAPRRRCPRRHDGGRRGRRPRPPPPTPRRPARAPERFAAASSASRSAAAARRPPTVRRRRPAGRAPPRLRGTPPARASGWAVEQELGAKRGEGTAGDSGRRRSAPASVWRSHPRTTWSRGGDLTGAPLVLARRRRARDVVERWPTGRTRASGARPLPEPAPPTAGARSARPGG